MADFQQAVDANQSSEMRMIAARLDTIQRDLTELKTDMRAQMADHEQRIRVLERGYERLDSRVNTFGMLQAAYATVAATIASVIGATR